MCTVKTKENNQRRQENYCDDYILFNSKPVLTKGRPLGDYNDTGIKGNTDFTVSATATPGAKDLDKEVELIKRKIDAGTHFLQTQPVYDAEQAKRFIDKVEPLNIPVLIGVMPLKSVKMAQYLNEKVPGIEVPESVIAKFERYGSGIPIANEFINEIHKIASGIHILAMGNVENMNKIMDHVQALNN